MENAEEVLQVLDEFQKVRPSEIPRELEDYLCWVAKTGDPVYQWSLVKALFREKLMRVMTEFYESCPTLDLTPCPNVEQFNYDIMKKNLLERLESFVNAPFTVQRICELLTTPKKEYNRIDKFMRAIEKNVLVVSTREPGPYGRRSENGDSLVNGSVEDDTSHHEQTSNDVDMENWVKDCTTTTSVPGSNSEHEELAVESDLNSSLKTSYDKQEPEEPQLSVVDAATSNFVSSSTDFSTVTDVTTPVSEVPTAIVQNLTTTTTTTANHEPVVIIGDVSDAIMNEDTSSQPSLELESDDSDSSDSKKLQTTFQAKDFTADEVTLPKLYSEVLNDKPEESSETSETNKECNQLIQSIYLNDKILTENTNEILSSDQTDDLNCPIIKKIDQSESKIVDQAEDSENCEYESNTCVDNIANVNSQLDIKESVSKDEVTDSLEALVEKECDTDVKDDSKTDLIKENITDIIDSTENCNKESSQNIEIHNIVDLHKPLVQEPILEPTDSNDIIKSGKVEGSRLTIEETTEDIKTNKTIVPDPIPIIEEPKDVDSVTKEWNSSVLVTDVSSEPKDDTNKNGLIENPTKLDEVEDNQMAPNCEEVLTRKTTSESMDIDNEALIPIVQQDEPMEQETSEAINS